MDKVWINEHQWYDFKNQNAVLGGDTSFINTEYIYVVSRGGSEITKIYKDESKAKRYKKEE